MIWNAFSQASGPKGTLFQMLVQAAELFLLFANLMPLLPSAYNVFLKSKFYLTRLPLHWGSQMAMAQ